MLLDFEVTLPEEDFVKLKKLAEQLNEPIGTLAVRCIREKSEDLLNYYEGMDKEYAETSSQPDLSG